MLMAHIQEMSLTQVQLLIMIQTLTAILLQLLQLEQDQVRVQELMAQLVQL